eukprot:scaffold56873_cov34-Prasinocladus_malaysianus.AAC.1
MAFVVQKTNQSHISNIPRCLNEIYSDPVYGMCVDEKGSDIKEFEGHRCEGCMLPDENSDRQDKGCDKYSFTHDDKDRGSDDLRGQYLCNLMALSWAKMEHHCKAKKLI